MTSPPAIPPRYRLATRQSVPILACLMGLAVFSLVLNYLHARDQAIQTARRLVIQLMDDLAKRHSDIHPAAILEASRPGQETKALSLFEHSIVFFLARDGRLTLTAETGASLERLKDNMRRQSPGESVVIYKKQPYLAVYRPLADGNSHMGLLIPREQLFARFDKITYLLGGVSLIIMALAAFGLYRSTAELLAPLKPLNKLAARMAAGKLEEEDAPGLFQPPPRFPTEMQRLFLVVEKLRGELRQRVKDLTLIGRTTERLRGELTFARAIQEGLRPKDIPSVDGLELAAFVHTAGDVGGDIYDYFLSGPRHLCCIMGNVTERGVPAALLGGRITPLLHELLLADFTPSKALESVNQMLAGTTRNRPAMVSVLVGALCLDSGCFRWACAGQPPPFRVLHDAVEQLAWTGDIPLGIRRQESYVERQWRLKPNELLLFSGQRLVSMTGTNGGGYDAGHLKKFMQGRKEPLPDLLLALYTDIRAHLNGPPLDDLTFFALRWQGPATTLPSHEETF